MATKTKREMTNSSPAQVFSAHLLAALSKAGVRNFFLAPGARSQALAIAAGQLASAGKIELHVRLDERSLGFTALGSALASGEPSVIITTSGTAVANLHPAVLEANHSGVPLILLTADRPHELRGVGANQTTNQVGIFADAVRECFDVPAPNGHDREFAEAAQLATDAIAIAMGYDGDQPGPVQLNLAFREPLSALEPNAATLNPQIQLPEIMEPIPEFAMLTAEVPTVVMAGAGAGDDAVELAEAFGWPLFAEPSSGARSGANAILGYRNLLDLEGNWATLAGEIGRVIVFGKPTLGRAAIKLLFNPAVEVVVVRSPQMGHFDVSRRAGRLVDEITVDNEVDFEWLENWRRADAEHALAHPAKGDLDRRSLVEKVWETTSGEDQLVLGASRLIREADVWAPAKALRVFSNRGLAGIDGTVATAAGIALVATEGTTRVLLGDLTLLHDASSLAIDSTESEPNLQVIVGNDGGGSIFSSLEMAKTLDEATFTRLFKTPQTVDLWHLAQAYGWAYARVENLGQLDDALTQKGRILVDVRLS
jgi:2-succinyl-5-enolpyruvyl-6-hydroxy-3-cyclohexene-1-carboxylate synthase